MLWFYGGLFKLNIAVAVLVVLKTPTCSILNCGLLYKTNSTTNSTHKEKKNNTIISYVNAILTPSDFKRCLRPISPYFFVTVASRSCINFVFESESNQFFLFCQVAILCWVPSAFTSSVMWQMPTSLDWYWTGKWTAYWIEIKMANGQVTGISSS